MVRLLKQVWDMASHQRIASFKRPASSLKGGAVKPHLFWEGEQLLYIGWGCSMRVGGRPPGQILKSCMLVAGLAFAPGAPSRTDVTSTMTLKQTQRSQRDRGNHV